MTTRAKMNLISKIAAALVVAFICALVPVSIDQNSGYAHVSEACAAAPAAGAASGLLGEYAAAAGLTESEFVATVGGIVTLGAGLNVAGDAGFAFGSTLKQNLDNLVNAADYPAWDTMSAEEQSKWRDKQDYDTAKFNQLMNGLGYEGVNQGYYDSFGGSSGATFDPDQALRNRLEQIGRIGSLWMGGASVKIGELLDMITNREEIVEWFPTVESDIFDATGIEDWPSGVPRTLHVYDQLTMKGNYNRYYTYASDTAGTIYVPFNQYYITCNKVSYRYGYSQGNGAYVPVTSFTFSGSSATYGGETFYCADFVNSNSYVYDGITSNGSRPDLSRAQIVMVCYHLLFDEKQASGGDAVKDYPDDVNPDQRVYMPREGISSGNTTFNDYTIQPVIERPDNPYNPDNQTGGNKWAEETTANVLPLAQLPFDKLFPFCLLYDVPLLLHKILNVTGVDAGGGLRAQAVPDYEKIVLDWPNPGGQEPIKFEIDLKWLRELLTLVKPAFQVLLLFGFLWASIQFWKGVITG